MTSGDMECSRFTGTLATWEVWLYKEMLDNRPDAIVLFGSNRPAHVAARRIAKDFGITLISLEEGYLRSGYITCEVGGNNQHSPFMHWTPGNYLSRFMQPIEDRLPVSGSAFIKMRFWAALYYLARDIFSDTSDEFLFHRKREHLLTLSRKWITHVVVRSAAQVFESAKRRMLSRNPGYILVPLQVSSDSQLQLAARGWNTPRLINSALRALADAKCDQKIVFKLHPLGLDRRAIKTLVRAKARELGLDHRRVVVLQTGRMSDLARQSSGMIVINSTSAYSALHHGKPVLVLGDAVYRNEHVATLGNSDADVASFLEARKCKPQSNIESFLADLKSECLLPGDFYFFNGRQTAVEGIVDKLTQLMELKACPRSEAYG
ncbi:hypothetical protein [Cognatiyoonia sp. IB215182]|uniref:capsular polysaccharide export protein, LipB/KpsS family n=1 Tax=Cognatiyoonia sp. IB215182 TaxID=3097353 RepID=UPI002A24672B|nr:hypothetical protein [Cognatiyoonia sp. IB215182]